LSNTFVSEGLPEPAAAPPSSSPEAAPASSPSEQSERGQFVDRARDAHSALERSFPVERDDDEQPVDLDKPAYASGDQRKSLAESVAPELLRPEPEPAPPEIEPPRAWKSEEKERFKALPPEVQKYIAENEAGREQYWNAKRNEIDRDREQAKTEAQRRYAADLQTAQEARASAEEMHRLSVEETTLNVQLHLGFEEFKQRYGGDITQPQLDALKQTNPALAADVERDLEILRNASTQLKDLSDRRTFRQTREAEQQQAEAQRARADQLKQLNASQDAEFAKRNPEFADDSKAAEIREKMVIPYLRDQLKLPPERIAYLWDNEPLFRSVESQQMLFDAARWRAAQQAARNAAPKTMPKPQSSNAVNGAPRDDVFAAANSGDMAAFFRLRAQGRSR
jgi:hypothetical protein